MPSASVTVIQEKCHQIVYDMKQVKICVLEVTVYEHTSAIQDIRQTISRASIATSTKEDGQQPTHLNSNQVIQKQETDYPNPRRKTTA